MSVLLHLLEISRRRDILDAAILIIIGFWICYLLRGFNLLFLFSEIERQSGHNTGSQFLTFFLVSFCLSFIYFMRRHSELKDQIQQRNDDDKNVAWIAQHDLLTKLPNRHFFQNFISHIDDAGVEEGDKEYGIFAIDLDGFKKVNDLLGHHGGDELLVTLSKRLMKIAPNDLIIRLGGDEFVIIAEWDSAKGFEDFAERIVLELSTPVKLADSYVEVGACVGVGLYPEDSKLISEVARCADVAMYVAKNNGRGSVRRFQIWMDSLLLKRAEIEQSLRQAVKNDEIIPNYQPLVDLASGEITGFEALARWTDPTGEIVPPSIFIEIAEESGLIITLTENLLRRCCHDALSWPTNLKLSFNISPTQLSDKLLGLRILNILGQTGLSPKRLEIEITESTLISDTDSAIKILQDLHHAGVSIAIDDFGTGYSSLSQLSQFNFDKIKIDKSFIAAFEYDEKSRNVVKAMMSLGEGLGISTLAEGIEEESQLDTLKEMGCNMGQGYLFGRPQDAETVLDMLHSLADEASYSSKDKIDPVEEGSEFKEA